MTDKLLSPLAVLAVVFVGLAFAAVSFFVFVTRGKSEFWTDKKMLLGGVLLSLTSFLGAGCSGCAASNGFASNGFTSPDVAALLPWLKILSKFNPSASGNSLKGQLLLFASLMGVISLRVFGDKKRPQPPA